MSIVVNVGMWFERCIMMGSQLAPRLYAQLMDHVPPHLGGCGRVPGNHRYLLHALPPFARYFPVVALNELKSILKSSGESYKQQQATADQHH